MSRERYFEIEDKNVSMSKAKLSADDDPIANVTSMKHVAPVSSKSSSSVTTDAQTRQSENAKRTASSNEEIELISLFLHCSRWPKNRGIKPPDRRQCGSCAIHIIFSFLSAVAIIHEGRGTLPSKLYPFTIFISSMRSITVILVQLTRLTQMKEHRVMSPCSCLFPIVWKPSLCSKSFSKFSTTPIFFSSSRLCLHLLIRALALA